MHLKVFSVCILFVSYANASGNYQKLRSYFREGLFKDAPDDDTSTTQDAISAGENDELNGVMNPESDESLDMGMDNEEPDKLLITRPDNYPKKYTGSGKQHLNRHWKSGKKKSPVLNGFTHRAIYDKSHRSQNTEEKSMDKPNSEPDYQLQSGDVMDEEPWESEPSGPPDPLEDEPFTEGDIPFTKSLLEAEGFEFPNWYDDVPSEETPPPIDVDHGSSNEVPFFASQTHDKIKMLENERRQMDATLPPPVDNGNSHDLISDKKKYLQNQLSFKQFAGLPDIAHQVLAIQQAQHHNEANEEPPTEHLDFRQKFFKFAFF